MGWSSKGDNKNTFPFDILNLLRLLTNDAPKLYEKEINAQLAHEMDTWKHYNLLCRDRVQHVKIWNKGNKLQILPLVDWHKPLSLKDSMSNHNDDARA